MAKRALLIGCNYPGTEGELLGCVNDVFRMKQLYAECFEFEDFTILVDTDEQYLQPTGEQIKQSLREIVEKTQSGDVLVVHFSGHGVQVPTDDPFEEDMLDEALVPTDLNLLLDDDLRDIFMALPSDAYFTFVSDCCHSGGMLDHEEIQISGNKDPRRLPSFDFGTILSMFGIKSREAKIPGFKNRSLPTATFMRMMSAKSGESVDHTNIRNVLNNVFGKAASSKVVKYMNELQNLLGNASNKDFYAKLTNLFSSLTKSKTDGDGPPKLTELKAGHKPPLESRLSQDVGVLVTGCQANETSADACPDADPSKAYGALSNAVFTIVRKNYDGSDSQKELSNRELVTAVRQLLSKGSFAQNPCLECSPANAERAFITGRHMN